jgi:hypothetical protein
MLTTHRLFPTGNNTPAKANRWRRYDRWLVKLAGFVALCDAACAFNPVYGRGMTTGALSR